MHNKRYLDEVEIELENISEITNEIRKIVSTSKLEESDLILKTAMASFMAQYYNGIENILKRITKYYNIPLPKTESWHFELFSFFCNPPHQSLPVLFSDEIKTEMNEIRKFRHRVHHGYSFTLEWNDLLIGANTVLSTFIVFSHKIKMFIIRKND